MIQNMCVFLVFSISHYVLRRTTGLQVGEMNDRDPNAQMT